MKTSTTNTWAKLAQPEQTAGQIALEINWAEITEGTEKQIKFANDLRSAWISDTTHRDNIANVRYAVVQQTQNGVDLTSIVTRNSNTLIYSYLANDAWNRRAINLLNTSSAKDVIDFFRDIKTHASKSNLLSTYDHVIRFPAKWNHDGKKWVRTDWS